MPITDWINVDTSLAPVPPAPPDTPRVYAMVAPAVTADVTDTTTLIYTIGELEDLGFDTGDVVYNAMAQLFAQTPTQTAVSGVVLIKRETPVANVWTIDIISTTDGNHTITVDGVLGATFAASTSTATEIKDGLVAAFNLGAFASTITAASVDTNTLSLTADVPGIPFTPTSAAPGGTAPTVTETVANVGVYDDLTAAFAENQFWGVLMPGALAVENDEGRRWVQADTVSRRNVLFADSSDVGVYDDGDTDNLAAVWLAAGYNRVVLVSHPTATDYMASAAVGRFGGAFPGIRTWHYSALTGSTETTVTANRTSAQTTVLNTRHVCYTERNQGPTSDMLFIGGWISDGHFIYQKHAEDWWWYTIRNAIDFKMKSNAGVDLTEDGMKQMDDYVAQQMIPLVTNGVIAPDFTVTHTALSLIPAGEIALGDFKTSGRILASATINPKLRSIRVSAEFAVA